METTNGSDDLSSLTQKEWVAKIKNEKRISKSEMPKIASIVWYDFFADKTLPRKSNPSLPLNDLLRQWSGRDEDVSSARVYDILIMLGYSESMANKRSFCKRAKRESFGLLYDGLGTVNVSGARSCLTSVCELAVLDVIALVKANVIVNGKVNPDWPTAGSNGVVGYKNQRQVEELIKWVSDGSMQSLLKSLDSDLKVDKFLERLGIENLAKNVKTKVLAEKAFAEMAV